MRRILVVLAAILASGLFLPSTAQAGNWAETLLDPPPARIDPGVTYTFGYWILQHGSYPYKGGDLGPTALVATDEKGGRVDFAGTESTTAGHYSAEVVFPHKGTWTISSQHGVLMTDALVATVTVPGAVRIAPSDIKGRAPHEWGTVRPSFPPTAPDAEMMGPGAEQGPPVDAPVTTRPAVAPRSQATVEQPDTPAPWTLITLGGIVVVGLAVWLGRRSARARR